MSTLDKCITALARKASQVAQLALAATMLLIVGNIILRTFWRSIPGTVEITEILGAIILGGSLAYCQHMKGHISVGVIVERFPKFYQALTDSITHFLAMIFSGILTWQIINYSISMLQEGYVTGHLGIPLAPFIFLVGIGFFIMSLVLLRDVLQKITLATKGCEET